MSVSTEHSLITKFTREKHHNHNIRTKIPYTAQTNSLTQNCDLKACCNNYFLPSDYNKNRNTTMQNTTAQAGESLYWQHKKLELHSQP
jgi:hypothetical protein